MIKKIYGSHITSYKWVDGQGGLINRCLEIYKTKTQYKGVLWNCGKRGWREYPNEPIRIETANSQEELCAKFFTKDTKVTETTSHHYGTFK